MNTRRTIGVAPGSTGSVGSCGLGGVNDNGAAMVDRARMIRGHASIVRRSQTICRSLARRLRNGVLILLFSGCFGTVEAYASGVNATWNGPGSSWNTATNWLPTTAVPTGIATFGASSVTSITASETTIDTLQFNSGAPAYSFAINTITSSGFIITGSGISNLSSNAPTLTVGGGNLYFNSTNATSSAGNAIIINNTGGGTTFNGNSTAGNANITNNGGAPGTGFTAFQVSSTAGNSVITTNSTGIVAFLNTSSGGQARFITNAGGIFDISLLALAGTSAGSIEGAGTYQLGSKALTVGGTNSSNVVSGNIVDGGIGGGSGASLVKVGAGTLTLSGNNTYTGVTTVSGGKLQAGSTTGLSASSAFTVNSTLDLHGNSNTVGSLAGSGIVTDSAATLANLTAGGNNLSTTFSGFLINGPGPLGLTKTGSGTLTLTGTNTYTGGTIFQGGTVAVNSDSNLGSGPLTFNLGTLEALAGGGITSSKVVVLNGVGTFLSDAGTFSTLNGTISGAGGLTKSGPGVLFLTGTNTYGGGTTVSAGTLEAGSSTAFSSNSAFTVNSELDLNGHSNTVASLTGNGTVSNYDELNSATLTAGGDNSDTTFSGIIGDGPGILALNKAGTGTMTLTGTNTYTGGTTITGGTLQIGNGGTGGSIVGNVLDNGTLTFNRSGLVTFSGIVSGAGALNQIGAGTLTLSGANSYSGNTTISAGILQAGSVSAFSPNSAFTVNSVLDLNGFSNTVGSLAGIGNATNNGGTAAILTAGGNNSSTAFSGTLTNGTSSLGLTKTGAGTMILSGANTYTGGTTVSVGALQVDGTLGNTAVTVQSGAVLAGRGTIGGSVTIQDGGHLAPGSAAQTLGVGALLLNPGSFLDYRLSTPGVIGSGVNTLVNVGGNLTLDGVLNVTNGGSFGSGAYRLLNYTGGLTDLTLDLGTLPTGFTAADMTVTTAVGGQVNLIVSTAGAPTQLWNGPIIAPDSMVHGGTGTWDNFTTNFTNGLGTVSQSWQNGVAVFAAEPGTVTLGADILYQGMQFTIDGYTVVGAGAFALHPTGLAMVSTDPGVTATIAAPIVGPGGLNKAGLGLFGLDG